MLHGLVLWACCGLILLGLSGHQECKVNNVRSVPWHTGSASTSPGPQSPSQSTTAVSNPTLFCSLRASVSLSLACLEDNHIYVFLASEEEMRQSSAQKAGKCFCSATAHWKPEAGQLLQIPALCQEIVTESHQSPANPVTMNSHSTAQDDLFGQKPWCFAARFNSHSNVSWPR